MPRKKKDFFGPILQGSDGYTTRIRRLYNKDQEVIKQGLGGYTTFRTMELVIGSIMNEIF